MERLFDLYDDRSDDGPVARDAGADTASPDQEPAETSAADQESAHVDTPAPSAGTLGPEDSVTPVDAGPPRSLSEPSAPNGTTKHRAVDHRAASSSPPVPAEATTVAAPPAVAQPRRAAPAEAVDVATPTTHGEGQAVAPRPPLAADPARPVRHVGQELSLAERLRPRSLDEFIGQEHLLGPGRSLRTALERGEVPPLILWGPPGCGRTSLARLVAVQSTAAWDVIEGSTLSDDELDAAIERAEQRHATNGRRTVLHIRDVEHLDSQHQAHLQVAIDRGAVQLVGSTTQNPVFELTSALVSRCKLVQLNELTPDDVRTLLDRAVADPHRGVGVRVDLTFSAQRQIVAIADGDGRAALEALETAVTLTEPQPDGVIRLEAEDVRAALKATRSERDSEEHFDLTSAFVKSMRGSDPDAAVYWLLRILESGEELSFITRRMILFAAEDVGLADPGALQAAVSAAQAADRVGLPEAKHVLVQATIALSVAPKSDSVTRALLAGSDALHDAADAPVPDHLRDAHYTRKRGDAADTAYRTPHDDPTGFVVQEYLPEDLHGRRIYEPGHRGEEADIARRVAAWRERAESAHSRRRSARGTRQGGFIEGIDRAGWTRTEPGHGGRRHDRGDDPQGRDT